MSKTVTVGVVVVVLVIDVVVPVIAILVGQSLSKVVSYQVMKVLHPDKEQ